MTTAKPCSHLDRLLKLETVLVIDSHVNVTNAFMRCTYCGSAYLLEMVDCTARTSLFRVSRVDQDALQHTARAIHQGSCDVNRSRAEIQHLANAAEELDPLILMQDGCFTKLVERPDNLPGAHLGWRELPCTGALIAAVT